ncbi:SDR family oxidoreductase [Basilea psittacipulmonis]|uniref:dTDP-4-dehydrorhamnose reductase n=1 Tax=Basilea psittacipulmonis DSM 24701 TaxID=1072685 RepID=A0A077DHT4_9BURK|nr:sugar nucleotide-binding protein [Basilea psittacipulmonis]AIL32698.1 hypothetical protein IX83_04685 [Basilea psittacipulmonis DSM 24701]
MRILILGKNGQLGRSLFLRLAQEHDVQAWSREDFCFQTSFDFKKIEDYQPDILINAVGFTQVDQAEKQQETAYQVNAHIPFLIAEKIRAAQLPTAFIHFSTDFVFAGNFYRPYVEEDTPSPINYYGITKAESERLLRQALPQQTWIFRLSRLYSVDSSQHFAARLKQQLSKQKRVEVVDDQWGHFTDTQWVSTQLAQLLNQLAPDNAGIYHLVPKEAKSLYQYALEVWQQEKEKGLFLANEIVPISTQEWLQKQHADFAKRPLRLQLSQEKIYKTFTI